MTEQDTGLHGFGAIYDLVAASKNASHGGGNWDAVEIQLPRTQHPGRSPSTARKWRTINCDEWRRCRASGPDGARRTSSTKALKDFPAKGYIGLQDHGSRRVVQEYQAGLIRSEAANDLRTLTATGASSTTRRSVAGATAGALALLGAILRHRRRIRRPPRLAPQRPQPPRSRSRSSTSSSSSSGLPLIASAAGWLLAGGEPPILTARRPLE